MDREIRNLVEKYRSGVEAHRDRFARQDDSAYLESGEVFLVLDRLSRDITTDIPAAFTGLYLRGGLENCREEDLRTAAEGFRLMTDLVDRGESDSERATALLEMLAMGVQIVLCKDADPDRFRMIGDVLDALGHGSYLMSDSPEPRDLPHLIYSDLLSELVRDAADREDTSRVQEALGGTWDYGKAASPFHLVRPLSLPGRSATPQQAACLAVAGVPGIELSALEPDAESGGFTDLVEARLSEPALDPLSPQTVLRSDPRILAVRRGPRETNGGAAGDATVLCLHNFSGDSVEFRDRRDRYHWPEEGVLREILSEDLIFPSPEGALFSLELQPREVMWLRFS
ncbi:MAG: hypothetical protein EA427_10010 [Spirochaetaceae bacterium]|nr:MAG: hypothetical protein EA427_10010 [Spirochaetaceae bacterium]